MKFKNGILNFIILIFLVAVIFVEFKVTYSVWYNRSQRSVGIYTEAASEYGKTKVSIDEISVYEEVPFDYTEGDVMSFLDDRSIRIKLTGNITDTSYSDYGYYYYTNKDGIPGTLIVNKVTDTIDDFRVAMDDFWHGKTSSLIQTVPVGEDISTMTFYQNSCSTGNNAVVYNEGVKLYYMIIDEGDYYYLLSAADPFIVTDEKVTAHFAVASDDPQIKHNYSTYETAAAYNKILAAQETDSSSNTALPQNPYTSTSLTGSHDTYTSEDDDKIRQEMVQLSMYAWDEEGKSQNTQTVIDVTSSTAKASQWNITASTYSYESNGLRLSALSATRTNTEFTLSGNVNNLLDSERPFVALIKYVDGSDKLLGVRVLDFRASPIPASGVTSFNISVDSGTVDIARITGVQFEVY